MTGSRALAGIALAAAAALTAGTASAQVPYQIGDRRGGVTIDTSVLDSLGPMPTVPEMLRPGTPVGETGYDPRARALSAIAPLSAPAGAVGRTGSSAPTLGVDSAPAPDWLRRPDAPRYAPLPDYLPKAAAAPGQGGVAPTLKQPAPPQRAVAPQPAPQRATQPAAQPAPQPTRTAQPQPAPAPPPAPVAAAPTRPAAPTTQTVANRAPEPPRAPPPPPPAPAATSASAPPPPPLPTRAEPQTQVAAATSAPAAPAATPSAQGARADLVRVPFNSGQSTLPDAARGELDALVTRLRRDEPLRVQLLAYADGTEDDANRARRLSLSRALAVRAYLIDKQIQSTRMDVRALGNRSSEPPKDRVDVVLVNR